jgi:VanZ family protein
LRIWAYWIPAAVIMAGIAFLSHQSRLPDVPGAPPDWLLHGIEFGVLAATCMYGVTRGFDRRYRSGKAAMLALSIAVVYGALDELHQSFVPGRDVSLNDWISDSIGALLVVFILVLVWNRSAGDSSTRRRQS